MFKEFSLEGKVSIVTGAGTGLGRAIALAMSEAGADLVCVGRTATSIEETAKSIRDLGGRALPIPTDVTKADQVEAMVQTTLKEFGRVDVLVNNAGALIRKPLTPLPEPVNLNAYGATNEETTKEEWHTILDTNLTGPFLCCRAVGPHMLERRSGKIINISSVAAAKGSAYFIIYAASKAGLDNFTRSLAREWAPYNINVNAIGPGSFPTPMNTSELANEQILDRVLSQVPFQRLGELRELGLLAVYLASEVSNYMTGQSIYLDGGALA